MPKLVAVGAFAAFGFAVAGPLQHVGLLPETTVGNASKAAIKSALNLGVSEAWGRCGPSFDGKGNNGWGNGADFAPGNSLAHQPKFQSNTGPSPSRSPRSGGGDR
ncbi:MAG TPA: hypothetical protein VFZ74_08960 [Burkholderiales bacterium]